MDTRLPSPWPLMGYAPGKYVKTCRCCREIMNNVDKYASNCLPCAVRGANEEMSRLRGDRTLAGMSPQERAGIMREIAAAVGV